MHFIRNMIATIVSAVSAQRVSRMACQGCDLSLHCTMPASHRRLCWEQRAIRPFR